jgi:hypothetical protein
MNLLVVENQIGFNFQNLVKKLDDQCLVAAQNGNFELSELKDIDGDVLSHRYFCRSSDFFYELANCLERGSALSFRARSKSDSPKLFDVLISRSELVFHYELDDNSHLSTVHSELISFCELCGIRINETRFNREI